MSLTPNIWQKQSNEIIARRDARIKHLESTLQELLTFIDNMHKPEYAVFTNGTDRLDGYELSEKFKAELNK